MMMDDCLFCRIAKGEIPCSKVYEDDNFLAFLDINPVNKGHTLVIPKEHYETFTDLPDEKVNDFMAIVRKVMAGIKTSLNPDGFNIFNNNKPAAGQEVPHLHFHVLPRYEGDGNTFKWENDKYAEGEMAEVTEKIRNNLE